MSVEATNFVWYHSTAEGSDRLVLLALADFADEDGNCFGSWGKLCQKTRLCRSTIANSVKRLRNAGHLVMVEKGHRKLAGNGAEASIWRIPGVSEMGLKLRPVQDLDPSGPNAGPKWSKCWTQVVQDMDPNVKKHKEQEETKSADAPAPAASQPSPPSLLETSVPPKSVSPPKPKKTPKLEVAESELQLPHGEGFRRAWLQFMEHRRHPIRGRNVPLTKRAAELVLQDMAKINEQQACEAINMAIKTAWIVPYIDKYVQEPVNVAAFIPRTGPVQPSDAERRMLALEALQAQRMEGAA
jgi:hypothetical protein